MKIKSIAAFALLAGFSSNAAYADNVCEIMARSLQQDTLEQGTSLAQFSQFKQLVKNDEYKDWGSASSSSHSFNGTLSIPDEVDLAIGDGQKSSETSWDRRRSNFLSKAFSETSSSYRSSSHLSQTNVAAVKAISECGNYLAERQGVFTQLVNVSPNRDAFVLKLWRNTAGDPNWTLNELAVKPTAGADFNCANGWQEATNGNKLKLLQQAVIINCQKNPDKHLLIAVQTSAGPAGSFDLNSVHEEFAKLKADSDAQTERLQSQINVLTSRLGSEAAERSAAFASLSASIVGMITFGMEGTHCPPGYTDLSTAILPRFRGAFDAFAFILPPDKSKSGNFVQNVDWPLDHIQLCMRQ